MALKTDLRVYFKRKAIWSEGTVAKKQIPNPEMLIPATENLNKAETEMAIEVKSLQHTKTYPN